MGGAAKFSINNSYLDSINTGDTYEKSFDLWGVLTNTILITAT